MKKLFTNLFRVLFRKNKTHVTHKEVVADKTQNKPFYDIIKEKKGKHSTVFSLFTPDAKIKRQKAKRRVISRIQKRSRVINRQK